MTPDIWTAVDEYFLASVIDHDAALTGALQASQDAGLPSISVSPSQGKLLWLLAKLKGAKKILEIGTLGGYSTIWMARALPADGHVVTLEFDQHHADVARLNLSKAGLEGKVEVIVGAALDTLPSLVSQAPFDVIFIDADKENNPGYFEWALRFSRTGTLIIIDNVVRGGGVVESNSDDPNIIGIRKVLEMIGKEPRVSATTVQTVGSKGYDGLALAVVL